MKNDFEQVEDLWGTEQMKEKLSQILGEVFVADRMIREVLIRGQYEDVKNLSIFGSAEQSYGSMIVLLARRDKNILGRNLDSEAKLLSDLIDKYSTDVKALFGMFRRKYPDKGVVIGGVLVGEGIGDLKETEEGSNN